MEDQLKQTKKKLEQTEGQIQGMKDRVAEAHKAMDKAVREHKELNERLEREFAEKDRRLKDSLKA